MRLRCTFVVIIESLTERAFSIFENLWWHGSGKSRCSCNLQALRNGFLWNKVSLAVLNWSDVHLYGFCSQLHLSTLNPTNCITPQFYLFSHSCLERRDCSLTGVSACSLESFDDEFWTKDLTAGLPGLTKFCSLNETRVLVWTQLPIQLAQWNRMIFISRESCYAT